MKKFDRLPPEDRKVEIRLAASKLFMEKGFRYTTMENIVANVTLSKGGVYRIYPSTIAILSDIILEGMHIRNEFYQQRAQKIYLQKGNLTINDVTNVICDSMVLLPEVSALYVEFLIEKRHSKELEDLYQSICQQSMQATCQMISQLNLPSSITLDESMLWKITDLMNTTVLGIVILNHQSDFELFKRAFESALLEILNGGSSNESE